MRTPDPAAHLTGAQARAADAGLKPMIPINGRPFLDYVLSSLADAGVGEVALVVAPDHAAVSDYCARVSPPSRVALTFIVQQDALGTANAVLAVAPWTGGDAFLVMNADNLYPVPALVELLDLDEPGLPAFDREDLVRTSNIPAARIQTFAYLDVSADGYLTGIIEKPGVGHDPTSVISMNCWRFDPRIFDACRDVARSARGEFELPEAVGLAIRRGVRFRAVPARGPVLDLSRRADMADVERRLGGVVPRP
jgi:glucose-1-phosphate thymidylyltransferase